MLLAVPPGKPANFLGLQSKVSAFQAFKGDPNETGGFDRANADQLL